MRIGILLDVRKPLIKSKIINKQKVNQMKYSSSMKSLVHFSFTVASWGMLMSCVRCCSPKVWMMETIIGDLISRWTCMGQMVVLATEQQSPSGCEKHHRDCKHG